MTDLSLILMDDIWDELRRRFDSVLLVTLKSRTNEKEERVLSYCGGKFACIGLAELAKQKILSDATDEE